jgi:4-hydroxy-2-oxoheptanedioate aldolase
MPEYLTAREIVEYHARGRTSLVVDRIPVLTDEAREVAQKLNFQIILRSGGPAPEGRERAQPRDCRRIPLKDRLNRGRQLIGTFIQVPHPVVSEFVGKLGFDFLLIDAEHSAMHVETVQGMLQGLASTPAYGIVRIPAISPEYVASYLDAGADAILVPQVRTLEEVFEIQNAALYPPEGKRGIGPGRSTDFGLRILEKQESPNRDVVVFIQIETREALDNLDAILAVQSYDLLFVGPGDLSMNLGIFGEFSNPLLKGEIERIAGKAKAHGKKIGIFAPDLDTAVQWLEFGFDLVTMSSDLGLVAQGAMKGLSRLEKALRSIE